MPLRPIFNITVPPPCLYLELACTSANVAEGAVLVMDTTADDTVKLPAAADVASGIMGVALLAGAADALHTIKVLLAGPYLLNASGAITRGDQVTVASSAGDVKSVSAATKAGAAIVGTAMESAINGAKVLVNLSPENSAMGAGSTQQVGPLHTARGMVYSNVANLAAFTSVTAGTILDGVTYVAGDRVFLMGQTTATQNGIYIVGTVAAGVAPLTRPGDFATGATILPASQVNVSEGTVGANTQWKLSSTGTLVIDTNNLVFQPLAIKQTVRCVSFAAATLATAFVAGQVVDGVTLVAGDRVLVANQAAHTADGVYIASVAGTPLLAPDFTTLSFTAGMVFQVSEGTRFANSEWKATAPAASLATDPAFYPRMNIGSTPIGTPYTTGFVFAATSPISLDDITASTTGTKALLVAGRGNGTVTMTGTGTDTVQFGVHNW